MVATFKKTGTGYIVELPEEIGEELAKANTIEWDVEVRGNVIELRHHTGRDQPITEAQYQALSERMHARYADAFRKLA